MNILYTNFHPGNGGGHATYIYNLANYLSESHDVTIATPASSRLFKLASKLHNVRCIDTVFSTRIGAMIKETHALKKIIRNEKFDLIHVNGSADHRQVMLATKCLSKKPKIIWTKHNTKSLKSFGNALRAKFGTDGAIGVSNFVSNILHDSEFSKLPIKTIYHGIDIDKFKPCDSATKALYKKELLGDISDDVLIMASVGGTDRDKGWLELAKAVADLPANLKVKVKLVIAGDLIKGNLLNDFQALGLEDNIIFPGLVDDPQKILAAADLGFVLSWHEAFSFAAAESMACGLPTLVSDAGGLPEVVLDGVNGWVVPAKDQTKISTWLNHILSNGWDKNMSAAARDRAINSFSLTIFAEHTLSFYQQVCK